MTTVGHLLDVARAEIGYKESPANSNNTKYGMWYGVNKQPWCGIFVSWCFAQAGAPLDVTTGKGYAYCPYGVSYFTSKGRWGVTPQLGAVVFYGSNGLAEHTGIVESYTPTTITAIEGNTEEGNDTNGGGVMRRTRPRNGWIIGYGLPDYDSEVRVKPMFEPPLVLRPIVATAMCPSGGYWQLGDDGSVYAFLGAPNHGGVNGKSYFAGRTPAAIVPADHRIDPAYAVYTIIATSGERYSPND